MKNVVCQMQFGHTIIQPDINFVFGGCVTFK